MVVSNTNVIREFQRLNAAFHLTKEEVKTVLQNSVRASFASETLKATLLQKIDERLPWFLDLGSEGQVRWFVICRELVVPVPMIHFEGKNTTYFSIVQEKEEKVGKKE